MKIDESAKKKAIRGYLGLILLIVSIAGCSNAVTKTPSSTTSTKPSEPTAYQLVLEKSLGRGIAEAADWAPDGSSFALATSVQVDIYDAQTFEVSTTLDTKQWSKTIAYSPDSRLLAVGDENGIIQIWDVASRKLLHKLIPTGKQALYSDVLLTFSSDGRLLVSSLYQTLYLWDVSTGILLDSFPGYLDRIFSLAISPDGKTLVATGYDKLYVRDISTKKLLYPPITIKDDVKAVLFDQDGGQFKTIGTESLKDESTGETSDTVKIKTWEVSSGRILKDQLVARTSISMIDIPPAQDRIAMAKEGEINIWDASARKITFSIQGKTAQLSSLAIGPDGQKLLTVGSGYTNPAIQVWDLASQQALKVLDQYSLRPVEAIFSPNEKLVAIKDGNQVTQIREVDGGRLLHSVYGGNYLTFSSDNKTIAYATGKTYGHYDTVMLANAETGEMLPISNLSCPDLAGLAFAPDGKTIAFGGYQCDFQIRNVQTGRLVLDLSKVEGNEYLPSFEPVFSPDGKRIALGGFRPRIMDAVTGKTLREMEAQRGAEVAFSPDGRYLAITGTGNYTEKDQVQIWDVAADRMAFTIHTLQDEVYRIGFSPDGRMLLLMGQTIELWDLWSGKPLAELDSLDALPVGLMLSADGRTLLTVGNKGTLETWKFQPEPQLALASQPTPTALPRLTATPVVPTVELPQVAELGKGYSSAVHRSPDGKLAGWVEGNTLKWFDTRSLKQLGSVE
ncbi:MAG: hypothetical protein WCC12_21700, partial [Anaerolineales bacterium]